MDSAALQKELFSKVAVAYDRVEVETGRVEKLIPTPEILEEREKRRIVPTMSGKRRIVRGVVEEQLTEVEGILDHLGALTENIDEASLRAQALADAEPVEGAEEIDISQFIV